MKFEFGSSPCSESSETESLLELYSRLRCGFTRSEKVDVK